MPEFSSWRSYWKFVDHVSNKFRFAWDQETQTFLDTVLATASERETVIPLGTRFWRSQHGHNLQIVETDCIEHEVLSPHPQNRMKPRPNLASDGRANPRGIPYLYLATTKETSIAEMRPWVGAYISVAQFRTQRELKIVNCSGSENKSPLYFKEPNAEKRTKAVWSHIDKAFSEPVTRKDLGPDYVPTQIIAELFKKEGFDGIAYKSNFEQDGYNVALFDLNAAELVSCELHEITKIGVETSQVCNPYFVRQSSGT